MKRATPPIRFTTPDSYAWHNDAYVEIGLFVSSLRNSAKLLIANLNRARDPRVAWDVVPIVSLYRHALLLAMKMMVGEGCGFLKSPTDQVTLSTTLSLRWLAQIVCQIVRAVQWEATFVGDGITNLAEFSALVAAIEEMEPVFAAVMADKRRSPGDVPPKVRRDQVLEIVPKIDALIVLLTATAEALAATVILMQSEGDAGTIQ